MRNRYGLRKYLTENERRAFLKRILRENDPLRRSFCLTLLFTGCRISEALNLTVERVDLSQKCLVFETLKQRQRGVFRAVPVPENLVAMLAKTIAGLPSTARLWPFSRSTAYRLVKRVLASADVVGVMASPKGLRHGFGAACVSQNVPLPKVKKWLGHARLETTAIYLDVLGEEERELASRLWLN
jgi:integrase